MSVISLQSILATTSAHMISVESPVNLHFFSVIMSIYEIPSRISESTHVYKHSELDTAVVVNYGSMWTGPDKNKIILTLLSMAVFLLVVIPSFGSVTHKSALLAWAVWSNGSDSQCGPPTRLLDGLHICHLYRRLSNLRVHVGHCWNWLYYGASSSIVVYYYYYYYGHVFYIYNHQTI